MDLFSFGFLALMLLGGAFAVTLVNTFHPSQRHGTYRFEEILFAEIVWILSLIGMWQLLQNSSNVTPLLGFLYVFVGLGIRAIAIVSAPILIGRAKEPYSDANRMLSLLSSGFVLVVTFWLWFSQVHSATVGL